MILYLRKKICSETKEDKELIEWAMEVQPAILLLIFVSLLWPWLSQTHFSSYIVGSCSDFLLLLGTCVFLTMKSPTNYLTDHPTTHTPPHCGMSGMLGKAGNEIILHCDIQSPEACFSPEPWPQPVLQSGRQQSLTCMNSDVYWAFLILQD